MAHSVNKHGDGSHSLSIFPLGHPVEITSTDASLLTAALGRWPSRVCRFDVDPLHFELKTGSSPEDEFQFQPESDGFSMERGIGCHAEFSTASRSGSLTGVALLEPLVLTALDWTFFIGVHAACVMRDGRSILLGGDSHAGKSTLAYACVRSGWTFVSDNALHWSSAPSDVLVSGSASLRLRDGAKALFALENGDITPGEHGMTTAPTAPSGQFVFLQRRSGAAAIHPCSTESAMRYISQFDTRPDREYAEERYRSLLRHGASTMQYEDVWDGVRCLETLL